MSSESKKKRKVPVWVVLPVVVLIIIGAALTGSLVHQRATVVLSLTGQAGQVLNARYEVDGVVSEEVLTVPVQKTFEASEFKFWVTPAAGSATGTPLEMELIVDGEPWMSWGSGTGEHHGVKGSIVTKNLIGTGGQSFMGGIAKGEIENLGYVP